MQLNVFTFLSEARTKVGSLPPLPVIERPGLLRFGAKAIIDVNTFISKQTMVGRMTTNMIRLSDFFVARGNYSYSMKSFT